MSEKKEVKIGVREGAGPELGYRWNVLILDVAFDEAMAVVSDAQYKHLALQVKEMAREGDPTHSQTVRIDKVEDFYEIKEKGGILGNLNVRLFFGVDNKSRSIVILGLIKKKNDGQTPFGDMVRMRRRWRKFQLGSTVTLTVSGRLRQIGTIC